MDGENISLDQHETRSEHRAHKLGEKIHELKEEVMSTDNTAAILAAMGNRGGVDGAAGLGMGGGLIGGVVLGALLGGNRNGLLGGGAVAEACVTPMQLTSGLASVIDSNQNTVLLQSVGDVKAAVPLAEAQVQLALAGAQADIMGQGTANATAAALASQMTNKNISDAIASSLASQSAIKESVAAYGVANLNATKDAQFATQVAIAGSTKEILAALNEQNVANLQRQLTVAETALLERNAALRARETEINITNTNTATATAVQSQMQAQQQFQILASLSATVANLANDIQVVRQGQTIFNSGTMAASGTQAAANTKVN